MNDIALVAQVAVFRNKRAMDQLVKKYQSAVRRFFLSHTLGDEQLADDLAQETFIKAYVHITSFKGLSGFSTWLYRIAYNVLYDYTRSHKPSEDVDSPQVALRQSAGVDAGLRIDLYEALARLKPEERTCITLQMMEGQPIEKICEITGMASGTVKSHLSRGKQKLSHYLKANGYE